VLANSNLQSALADLVERLRASDTLIIADYRGLTMPQIDDLRTELLKHGAKFTVVKNTLTRRAAEAAGAEALLALLEGPTAIAFLEADGDPVAVAKAIGATSRETKVLAVRGGILDGRPISAEEVESLAMENLRAFIDALSVRYVKDFDVKTRKEQDQAYADAMAKVAAKYPKVAAEIKSMPRIAISAVTTWASDQSGIASPIACSSVAAIFWCISAGSLPSTKYGL
jgi:large subunit ribosomal protein L10